MKKVFLSICILLSIGALAQKSKESLGYDKIHPYRDSESGRIAKVEKAGKQGFIKEDGSEHVPCKYDNIFPWEAGRAKVQIGAKFGFVRESDGEEYIPVKYDYIGPFKNGLAIVVNNGKRGLINEDGEEVVPVD
jgi:hypothetical protein